MSVIDQFRLDGRVVVVTGGSRGLGKAMAEAFSEAGAETVICSRSEAGVAAATEDVQRRTDRPCLGMVADVTNAAEVTELTESTLDRFGRIDAWVNNAGMNMRHPVEDFPEDEFDEIIGVNLKGTWLCCRAVSPIMKRQGKGAVLNLGSVLSSVGLAERTAYCSSKSGILGLTRTLALEWAPSGVRCNALCPGPFLTEINEAIASDPVKVEAVIGQTAFRRWAKLPEIQGPALFLVSDASSYMTGAALYLDGGWSAS